jgi:hypothetical protein
MDFLLAGEMLLAFMILLWLPLKNTSRQPREAGEQQPGYGQAG